MTEKTLTVKVKSPFRVVDPDGHAHTNGDKVTVAESVAQEWLRARWVERITGSK